MENELSSEVSEPQLSTEQHEEAPEKTKESSDQPCKRKDSPSANQRNYRKRSVSESPEKSPENSPSSRKRNRNSDYRGKATPFLFN